MKRNLGAKYLTQAALIAAIYVVLVLVFRPFAFGEVQVRISEALTILPFFTPAAIPGLFIGCLLANLLGGALLWDIIFGSLATLAAAVISYKVRKKIYLVPLAPVLINAVVVGLILKYVYEVPLSIPLLMVFVGIGQVIACYVLGLGLLFTLKKYQNKIFM